MAFNTNTQAQSKNQFIGRLVSNKTGATVCWINVTDDMARKVFGVAKVSEITAEQATEVLPELLGNKFVSVSITDLMLELEPVDAKDF